VVLALADLRQIEVCLTGFALVQFELSPYFPIDFFPGNPIGLSNEGDKLLQVPVLVHHVLLLDLAVLIYVGCLWVLANEVFSLSFCEHSRTIRTFIQIMLVFF